MVALPANAVEPDPVKEVREAPAVVPVKFKLPELFTAPTALVPETLAVALAAILSEAAELKLTAFKVPALTAIDEV